MHSSINKKQELKQKRNVATSSEYANMDRSNRTLFFGNVPRELNKKTFLKFVKRYGEVERMWIRGIKPLSANVSKKIAFIKKHLLVENHPPLLVYVLFKTESDAKRALQLNGEMYENHRLRVTLSDVKEYDKSKGVFVGNLPLAVQEDQVHEKFSSCGDIVSVRIIRDKISGKGKGIGYVNFRTSDAVELALKLNGEMFDNREIRVQRLQNAKRKDKQKKNIKIEKSHNNNKLTKRKPKKSKNITKTELKKKKIAKLLSHKNSRSACPSN